MAMTDREQSAAIDDLELVAKLLAARAHVDQNSVPLALVKSVTGRMLDSLGPSKPREALHPRRSDPEGVGEAPHELGSGPPPLRSCRL